VTTKGACFEVILEAATSFEMTRLNCPDRNDRGRAPRARAQPQRVVSAELSSRSFKYFPNTRSRRKQTTASLSQNGYQKASNSVNTVSTGKRMLQYSRETMTELFITHNN